MGYDFTTAHPMTEQEQAVHAEATQRFHAAVEVRNALPKEEKGVFRGADALDDEGIDWDDHRAYAGRSEQYIAAQDTVEAAYEAMQQADRSYFRLNMGGMARFGDVMMHLGMIQGVHRPYPFPDAPDNVDDDFYEQVYAIKVDLAAGKSQDTLPASPVALAYAQAVYALLSWTPATPTGMADFKFSTNDGWHVTPAEITAALAVYRTHAGEDVRDALDKAGISEYGIDHWGRWIGYLIYAESHGGFLVR